MKRPSFQFYPGDWRNNAKLRRCSEGARGVWIDVMCLMHDSDEYGVLRWPLVEIARAAGVRVALLRELVERQVMKGGDRGTEGYVYVPRSGRKDGEPVRLIDPTTEPCWFSSRMVKDEYVRQHAGASTRFGSSCRTPSQRQGEGEGEPDGGAPGRRAGGGSSSSSSTSLSPSLRSGESRASRNAPRVPMPPDFGISDRVREWAAEKGHDQLELHLEAFRITVEKHGYTYANWDAAFMEAIREDWAGVRSGRPRGDTRGPVDLWWQSDEGIKRKGREIGLEARGNETYASYRDRIRAALDQAGGRS